MTGGWFRMTRGDLERQREWFRMTEGVVQNDETRMTRGVEWQGVI